MELRLLQIIDNENISETEHSVELQGRGMLLDYFVNEVSCNNNFEFVQALIRLFLKIHGETIRCQVSLQEKARKLLETQSATWERGVTMTVAVAHFATVKFHVVFLDSPEHQIPVLIHATAT